MLADDVAQYRTAIKFYDDHRSVVDHSHATMDPNQPTCLAEGPTTHVEPSDLRDPPLFSCPRDSVLAGAVDLLHLQAAISLPDPIPAPRVRLIDDLCAIALVSPPENALPSFAAEYPLSIPHDMPAEACPTTFAPSFDDHNRPPFAHLDAPERFVTSIIPAMEIHRPMDSGFDSGPQPLTCLLYPGSALSFSQCYDGRCCWPPRFASCFISAACFVARASPCHSFLQPGTGPKSYRPL
jgi:hypothetical protein